jgi:hypothetical protein
MYKNYSCLQYCISEYHMLPRHLRVVIGHTKLYLQSLRSKRILLIYMTASVDHQQLLCLMMLRSHHSAPVCIIRMFCVLYSSLEFRKKYHIYVCTGHTHVNDRKFCSGPLISRKVQRIFLIL